MCLLDLQDLPRLPLLEPDAKSAAIIEAVLKVGKIDMPLPAR
jgi:hypothetical protein